MATATLRPRPDAAVEHLIDLKLTRDEAETLIRVTARISGDPDTSRRCHTDAIGDALSAAGVHYTFGDPNVEGGLYFRA